MKKKLFFILLVSLLIVLIGWIQWPSESFTVDKELAKRIGLQIWKNESQVSIYGLTCWNKGEECASLGIGHFIWYPEGCSHGFKDSFPTLIRFFKKNHVTLPTWLETCQFCPWQNRDDFQSALHSQQMQDLRHLLLQQIDLQILFMVRRMQKSLKTMLKHVPVEQRKHITFQFNRLASTSNGLYVLIDYLNFKGEGLKKQESYQGKRWGLLQVLESLKGTESGQPAVEEFVKVAKKILEQRVAHAPSQRKEEKWIPGWFNRLETYQTVSF